MDVILNILVVLWLENGGINCFVARIYFNDINGLRPTHAGCGTECSVVFDITRSGAGGGGKTLGEIENKDNPVEPLVIIRFITTIYI